MYIKHHHPATLPTQERAEQLHSLSYACLIVLHQNTPCPRIWRVQGTAIGSR